MNERKLLNISLATGIGLLPILFRKPGIKTWSTIYVSNAIASQLTDKYFVKTKRLKYPIRLYPKTFDTEIMYDYLICPMLTILYCQSSYNSSFKSTAAQGFLYAIPQVGIEYLAEKKTKLIKYTNGWTWMHSLLGITIVKYTFRGLFELLRPKEEQVSNIKTSESLEYKENHR